MLVCLDGLGLGLCPGREGKDRVPVGLQGEGREREWIGAHLLYPRFGKTWPAHARQSDSPGMVPQCLTPGLVHLDDVRQAAGLRRRHSFQPVLSSLDRPSLLMAWRPGPAVRRWARPASAFEHPAMTRLCLLSRDSSYRSVGARGYLLNRCQSFDRCSRAWDQSRRPYRRCCRDRRVRCQRSRSLRRSL